MRHGKSALPELERILDLLERDGSSSRYSHGQHWYWGVYARIAGREGIERILRHRTQPNLVAMALGLDRYVNESVQAPPGMKIFCHKAAPADGLEFGIARAAKAAGWRRFGCGFKMQQSAPDSDLWHVQWVDRRGAALGKSDIAFVLEKNEWKPQIAAEDLFALCGRRDE